jgi:signal transduction histidine kinase
MMRDWPTAAAALSLAGVALELARRARVLVIGGNLEGRFRKELEAYAGISEGGNAQSLGKRVCKVVTEASGFRKSAMLMRNADRGMFVAGSAGMDDETMETLNQWGRDAMESAGTGPGTKSFQLRLQAKNAALSGETDSMELWVVPLLSMGGRILGALVVGGPKQGNLVAAKMFAIETLATKLARSIEIATLSERLLRSEKLAGLGQLAGGVAHALNNPLTAVLGFAELIGETAEDPRLRRDAASIAREAVRMQETVQSLLDLWRPAMLADEAVNLADLVRELGSGCTEALKKRGVQLIVEVEDKGLAVRGNRARLQQVFEHLLNNAAGSVGSVAVPEGGHVIRVTVGENERGVRVVVSDTGRGFAEPGRVFDPYDTAQDVGQGAGLGLSICYGIVREHGGEISALNLHPQGAAVVMEFPVAVEEGESAVLIEGEALEQV